VSERIGDLLVRQGLIQPRELEEALEAQVLVGARLGTNLVEALVIDLDDLAEALGEQHGLPPAKKQHFERADLSVQARLSPRLAGTWHAVPLGAVDGGRIAVAVLDPLPPEGVEAISGALGAPIVQAIAPELRLFYELERGFGLRRPNRLVRVPPTGDMEPDEVAPKVERRRYVRTLSTNPGSAPIARVAVQTIAMPADEDGELPTPIASFSDALRAIRRATGRDRVAEVALEAIRRGTSEAASAAIIFVIRKNVAFGWRGYCERAGARLDDVAVPLAEASVLSAPLHRGPYAGPAPSHPTVIDEQLWSLLGASPRSYAVAPVDVGRRTSCLLYAHSPADDTFTAVTGHRLSELAQSMSTAFEFLIRAAER
jgi:hypothetical protein